MGGGADVVRDLPAVRPGLGHRSADDLLHHDLLGRQRRLAGVHAGEVEQVGRERAEPFGLVEGRLQRRRIGARDPVDEVLEQGAECGQRGPQLVADVRHQLAALPVHRGQVLGHPVEGSGELAHFVVRRGPHPAGVVAAGHPARGGSHLAQRRGHPRRQQLGDAERERDGDVTGDLVDLSAPVLALLRHALEGRDGHGEQLDDD